MTKQELIENVKGLTIFSKQILNVKLVDQYDVIKLIERLDEPQKPVVPQFVADWIEKTKKELSLREAMSQGYAPHEVDSWLREMDQDGACLNQETFARAWLDGYEVEKEKRYLVKIRGLISNYSILKYQQLDNSWFMGGKQEYEFFRFKHTRKELEEVGFGWVFDCEGVEVEEVEG